MITARLRQRGLKVRAGRRSPAFARDVTMDAGAGENIRIAQGLSDDVIARTRVKRGEGIAGLAASERSILLVDQEHADPRLQRRMLRPELASSLVAPLAPDDSQEPIGILNLRTTDPKKRFTKEHVELLKHLLDIVGVALSSLRLAFSQPRSPSS